MEKYTRKITKTSTYTYAVVIPKEVMQKYGWKGKQKLTLTDLGHGRLEVRDWRGN
jgi:bifunctional DNA-binding transcriptional regulator/antitoxin component of YhaV-PrlF toxin-antitoxin module